MIKELCDVMERCYDLNWITTRDGNASFRRKDSKYLYVTPSGVRKNVIRVEDIVRMSIEGNQLISPEGTKPSGEIHMHWLLQGKAPNTRSVLHVHPTYTIAAMHAGWDLQKMCEPFAEIYRYTRVGPNVPAIPAVTKELGTATYLALCPTDNLDFDIVGQVGHGICAVARDPWSCFEHVERLEHIAKIVLASGVKPTV